MEELQVVLCKCTVQKGKNHVSLECTGVADQNLMYTLPCRLKSFICQGERGLISLVLFKID